MWAGEETKRPNPINQQQTYQHTTHICMQSGQYVSQGVLCDMLLLFWSENYAADTTVEQIWEGF